MEVDVSYWPSNHGHSKANLPSSSSLQAIGSSHLLLHSKLPVSGKASRSSSKRQQQRSGESSRVLKAAEGGGGLVGSRSGSDDGAVVSQTKGLLSAVQVMGLKPGKLSNAGCGSPVSLARLLEAKDCFKPPLPPSSSSHFKKPPLPHSSVAAGRRRQLATRQSRQQQQQLGKRVKMERGVAVEDGEEHEAALILVGMMGAGSDGDGRAAKRGRQQSSDGGRDAGMGIGMGMEEERKVEEERRGGESGKGSGREEEREDCSTSDEQQAGVPLLPTTVQQQHEEKGVEKQQHMAITDATGSDAALSTSDEKQANLDAEDRNQVLLLNHPINKPSAPPPSNLSPVPAPSTIAAASSACTVRNQSTPSTGPGYLLPPSDSSSPLISSHSPSSPPLPLPFAPQRQGSCPLPFSPSLLPVKAEVGQLARGGKQGEKMESEKRGLRVQVSIEEANGDDDGDVDEEEEETAVVEDPEGSEGSAGGGTSRAATAPRGNEQLLEAKLHECCMRLLSRSAASAVVSPKRANGGHEKAVGNGRSGERGRDSGGWQEGSDSSEHEVVEQTGEEGQQMGEGSEEWGSRKVLVRGEEGQSRSKAGNEVSCMPLLTQYEPWSAAVAAKERRSRAEVGGQGRGGLMTSGMERPSMVEGDREVATDGSTVLSGSQTSTPTVEAAGVGGMEAAAEAVSGSSREEENRQQGGGEEGAVSSGRAVVLMGVEEKEGSGGMERGGMKQGEEREKGGSVQLDGVVVDEERAEDRGMEEEKGRWNTAEVKCEKKVVLSDATVTARCDGLPPAASQLCDLQLPKKMVEAAETAAAAAGTGGKKRKMRREEESEIAAGGSRAVVKGPSAAAADAEAWRGKVRRKQAVCDSLVKQVEELEAENRRMRVEVEVARIKWHELADRQQRLNLEHSALDSSQNQLLPLFDPRRSQSLLPLPPHLALHHAHAMGSMPGPLSFPPFPSFPHPPSVWPMPPRPLMAHHFLASHLLPPLSLPSSLPFAYSASSQQSIPSSPSPPSPSPSPSSAPSSSATAMSATLSSPRPPAFCALPPSPSAAASGKGRVPTAAAKPRGVAFSDQFDTPNQQSKKGSTSASTASPSTSLSASSLALPYSDCRHQSAAPAAALSAAPNSTTKQEQQQGQQQQQQQQRPEKPLVAPSKQLPLSGKSQTGKSEQMTSTLQGDNKYSTMHSFPTPSQPPRFPSSPSSHSSPSTVMSVPLVPHPQLLPMPVPFLPPPPIPHPLLPASSFPTTMQLLPHSPRLQASMPRAATADVAPLSSNTAEISGRGMRGSSKVEAQSKHKAVGVGLGQHRGAGKARKDANSSEGCSSEEKEEAAEAASGLGLELSLPIVSTLKSRSESLGAMVVTDNRIVERCFQDASTKKGTGHLPAPSSSPSWQEKQQASRGNTSTLFLPVPSIPPLSAVPTVMPPIPPAPLTSAPLTPLSPSWHHPSSSTVVSLSASRASEARRRRREATRRHRATMIMEQT